MATKRIAVLGGGIGGLSTAYEIVCKHPEHEVTVFEMSWRLGGKCASQKNLAIGERNEEHGIHVLFGCYENAFHLLKRVYAELGLDWKHVFIGEPGFTIFDKSGDSWEPWTFTLPRLPGEPGNRVDPPSRFPSVFELAKRGLRWVWDHVLQRASAHMPAWALQELKARVEKIFDQLDAGPTEQHIGKALEKLEDAFERFDKLANVQRRLANALHGRVSWSAPSKPLRQLRVVAEIGLAAGAGLLRASIRGRRLYDLNDVDFIEWLKMNAIGGGLSQTAEKSGPLRMIYEASFAYEDGDTNRPNYAAGTVLYVLYRMLIDYRGYQTYKMRNGTAEALITPLYRALLNRNVRFEFFHRVDEIALTADQRNVKAVRFGVQSKAINGSYEPLIDGTDSWPTRPKYELLENGNILDQSDELVPSGYDLDDPRTAAPPFAQRTITWRGDGGGGEDSFDDVILAIPPAASRRACKALERSNTVGNRWRNMFDGLKDTPTQSCQIWFDRDAKQLGWKGDPGSALTGAYEQPLSNWADYSCVLASEKWPVDVRSVAYLCGCLVETSDLKTFRPAYWRQVMQENAEKWLEKNSDLLWPSLFVAGQLDWNRLVDLGGKQGKERLAAQYVRANLSPSGRYLLSVKGSFKYRLAAWESGFDNLFLAGDWTRNGADNGCVEATVMSARRAARAILALRKDELPVYGEDD
jgi:uncharacterized protein with NAD-binding domain and iron-sulfur cluster